MEMLLELTMEIFLIGLPKPVPKVRAFSLQYYYFLPLCYGFLKFLSNIKCLMKK